MKPDPHRLNLDWYVHRTSVPPRASDMDSLKHVNNVAIAAIYDEGRASLVQKIFGSFRNVEIPRIVTAQVNISYLGEGFYPGMFEIGGAITRIGTSSFSMGHGLFQDGLCIGVCDSVFVCTGDKASAPMSPGMIESLKAFLKA
jgi:acyl-CoA thioester hydrolase